MEATTHDSDTAECFTQTITTIELQDPTRETIEMHPVLHRHYQMLGQKYDLQGPFLEVGASPGGKAILAGPYFSDKDDRVAINLNELLQEQGIDFKRCNSNDMGIFKAASFRTVLSNAVLEHDRRFWLSISEMRRVLMPSGIMIVGVPAFVPMSELSGSISGLGENPKATITYDVHARPDYWRFSRDSFTEVIMEGMEILEIVTVGEIPRLVAVGRKVS